MSSIAIYLPIPSISHKMDNVYHPNFNFVLCLLYIWKLKKKWKGRREEIKEKKRKFVAYYIIGFTCPVIFPIHVHFVCGYLWNKKIISLVVESTLKPTIHVSRYRWTYIQFLNFYTHSHTEHHVSSTLPSRCAGINVRRWEVRREKKNT